AVVVDVSEERLRRAIEDREARRFGKVLERAVSLVSKQTVGQPLGLRDLDVVKAVAINIADRYTVMPHPTRHEYGVEMRCPVVEPGYELPKKRRIRTERCLGDFAEDWGRCA